MKCKGNHMEYQAILMAYDLEETRSPSTSETLDTALDALILAEYLEHSSHLSVS